MTSNIKIHKLVLAETSCSDYVAQFSKIFIFWMDTFSNEEEIRSEQCQSSLENIDELPTMSEALSKMSSRIDMVGSSWKEVAQKNKKQLEEYEKEIRELTESKAKIARRLQDTINIKDQVMHWKRSYIDCERKKSRMELSMTEMKEVLKKKNEELKICREEIFQIQTKGKKKYYKKMLKETKEEINKLKEENCQLNSRLLDKANMVKFLYDKVNQTEEIIENFKTSYEGEKQKLVEKNQNLADKIKLLKNYIKKIDIKSLQKIETKYMTLEKEKLDDKKIIDTLKLKIQAMLDEKQRVEGNYFNQIKVTEKLKLDAVDKDEEHYFTEEHKNENLHDEKENLNEKLENDKNDSKNKGVDDELRDEEVHGKYNGTNGLHEFNITKDDPGNSEIKGNMNITIDIKSNYQDNTDQKKNLEGYKQGNIYSRGSYLPELDDGLFLNE